MIYSKKRELVLDYVRAACTHPTADEVYAGLRAGDADVSLATVYRNLNQPKTGRSGASRRLPGRTGSMATSLRTYMRSVPAAAA